jgi:hypothetical protein
MQFFTIEKPTPPKALLLANSLLEINNEELERRIQAHIEGFRRFWFSSDGTTPDEIAEALGNKGVLFYELSILNITHILSALVLAGLDINAIFPPSCYTPIRPIIKHADGTITIEPAPVQPEYTYIMFDDITDGEQIECELTEEI